MLINTAKSNLLGTKKGFTLVEIIVVITIMGIIAAMTVPSLTGFIAKNNEKQYRQEIESAYQTVQTLFAFEQARNSDVNGVVSGTAAGKYIDPGVSGKLTNAGITKYIQLSGRDPKITVLTFSAATNSVETLTIASSDGKADMSFSATGSPDKYTITIR